MNSVYLNARIAIFHAKMNMSSVISYLFTADTNALN